VQHVGQCDMGPELSRACLNQHLCDCADHSAAKDKEKGAPRSPAHIEGRFEDSRRGQVVSSNRKDLSLV
jgi:hypothetical protein